MKEGKMARTYKDKKCLFNECINVFNPKHSKDIFCEKCKIIANIQKQKNKKEYNKKYKKDNSEKIKQLGKDYYLNNRENKLEYQKNYYANNTTEVKQYQYSYKKNKRATDGAFRLKLNISRLVNMMLKGSKAGKSVLKYLPYTMEELKIHIESKFEFWMNWDNQGIYKIAEWNEDDSSTWRWQLDHIIPQSKLIYTSMDDENFKKCWSLENLQPLSAKKNLEKGNKC